MFQINNLNFHFKEPKKKKKEQNNPKASIKKEVEIKGEIHGIENRKNIRKKSIKPQAGS